MEHMRACMLSYLQLFVTPGSSVLGIILARIWSGLPFPSPEDLPNPRLEPIFLVSPTLAGGFFTLHHLILEHM